ncbi:uncharacterized protein CLAFUR5_09179 [Fulvia fulva]|uniref:Involucrin repeat protein n=1 Tax=Passalora fulva TaxID=5499 RepID=A0A9Q8UU20_PASFU|nr:uncharacterized protein CLAFUR5_09179 [Fulvia fulva]UJO22362.1 hypothetical protein CLAFUR5_09179 [Fulvia fulva]
MWKAAFQGRSEKGGEASVAGKPTKDESQSRKKKSGSHSHRAESVISTRDDERDRERRKSGRAGRVYDSGGSKYETGSSYTSSGPSQYVTAPSSRVGEVRALTASALRMLPDDEEEWEDDEKDARSERSRKSGKRGSGDEKRRKSARSEKERSRSHSRERREKRKENKTTEKPRDKDRERSRREPELVSEGSRAMPMPGSFEQFPGQYAAGQMGPSDPAVMSGALPSDAYQHQFPGQDPYARPQMPPSMPSRADSYGHAADYYLDEGQSVQHQPGHRAATPNMLVNPDLHLIAASAEANPAQDTGHGSAADFYGGEVSPVPYSKIPTTAPTTPAKVSKPSETGKTSASAPSSSSKPKPKTKSSRTSSTGVAAAAVAAGAGIAALSGSSHQHSQSQQQNTSSSSYQQGTSFTSKPTKPTRHNSEGSAYYTAPSTNSTYPPTLPSTNGYGAAMTTNTGTPGRQTNNSSSNVPLYAAAAAGAAGLAAHDYNQHHQHSAHANAAFNTQSGGGYGGGGGQGPPRSPRAGPGGAYYGPPSGQNGGMAQMPFHEHKGPLTRIKDGLFNIISTPEDVAKMEMYTEYIGVCKHCFDPRTSAWDAPRVHHYHKRRDSFESLRKRRSAERLGRMGSSESLRRQGGTRVDKDNRYYASESSRRKRESGGVGILGAGLAAAGGLAAANALRSDRRDFDDTYSVKSGHRESSAVRRRSRSSSREQRRQSQYGVIRPDRDEFVTVRKKDGSIEQRQVSRKSRSSSRERKSSGMFGAAAAGAALEAAGMAASSRRHRSRSRSHSPTVIGGFGASETRSRRSGRRSPTRSSYHDISRNDRPQESSGLFGGFFSPPRKEPKRRNSPEHQKKRKGFFTFSNSSASSSNSDIAFGEGFASRSSLGLSRKSSVLSNRSARRTSGRASRKRSDDHLGATIAGIGATAAALAAAQRGHRISKRTSRPELGRRRDVRHSHADSSDEEWEDELPSDVDDSSSIEGGLAYGNEDRRLSGRQSMDSIASQSSAGGLGAWGWRWGGKDKKRRSRQSSSQQPMYDQRTGSAFAAPGLAGLAAGAGAAAAFDTSRPMDKPVYLDDTGRPLPSPASTSTASGPTGPLQYVDPAPISDVGTPSRYSSMPGSFDEGVPVSRPGPDILRAPQPISPAQPAFTQSPPELESPTQYRPGHPRRANSSPTRGHFAQDAALIGGAALATAGAIAGMSSISGRSGRDKEASRVSFGFTEEQQAKEDREHRREQKLADEERRRADRTRALKEEADRAAKEARQEEVRRQREEENRKAAEVRLERDRAAQRETEERAERERQNEVARLERERTAQREAEQRAERERQKETARVQRERLEQEARDRQAAASAAAAEVEKHRKAREEAERRAEIAERERRERNDAYAREQARLADEYQRRREAEEQNQYDAYAQRYPSQSPEEERKQWPSARQQTPQYGSQSPESERKYSSGWGSVAAGAAAAATVGAVMAGREHDKKRDRKKSRDDGYSDKGHQDHSEQRYGTSWESAEKNASSREPEGRAELERRASEKYGRGQTGVEVRDGYAAAEIKPKNEHEGEPLMDDDIYDPDFFKKKHTAVENARYAEFARKAADKVVHDREHAYDDDKNTSYADFFAPKELLAKEAEGKTRPVSPDGDMDMQVFHLRDTEIRSSFGSDPDHRHGRSKSAPHGVPRLNVIAPTPPPSSAESSPLRSKEHTKSPLSKEQVIELANELNKSSVSQSRSENSERSRSISWGDDSTHYYDVDTPDSHPDRDSYITSPDIRNNRATTAAAGVAGAAAAGAALHEIVVEDPSGGERRYTEEEWLRDEERDTQAGADDDRDVEDITPSPGPGPRDFYQQPFFDSVSDMGTGIFNVSSPGTRNAPPARGFVEGETDEPTPVEEKKPRIPGGFDDDMDDIYRPRPKRDNDPVTAEIQKEQAAAAVASAAEEVSDREPPLSKKEKKKREKEAKKSSSVVESEPSTYFAAEPEPVPEPVAEPAWEPPLSKKEQKKREKEAKRQSIVEEVESQEPAPVAEPAVVASEPAWEPPLSAKEKKKREKEAKRQSIVEDNDIPASLPANDNKTVVEEPAWEPPLSAKEKKKREKAAKRSSVAESDPPTPVKEPEPVPSPTKQVAIEPEGDDFLSKKDKKKRDKARKESGDLAHSIDDLPAEPKPIDLQESSSSDQPAADEQEDPLSKKDQKKRDKERLADAAIAAGGIAAAAAVLDSTEDSTSGSNKKKKGKKSKLGEPSYDDPRDLPSDLPPAPEPPRSEPHGMPGGWDSDRRESEENVEDDVAQKATEKFDEKSSKGPSQYQMPEESTKTVEPETPVEDDWANFTSSSKESKKKKKKSKRNSAAFNIPEVSSPLRSEIPFDDYVSANDRKAGPEPYTNGYSKDDESSRTEDLASSREFGKASSSGSRDTGYFDEPRRRSDSPKQTSPEDTRSSTSDERKSRREEARRGSDYYDEPSYAYETASVAGTELGGDYERSSKSKRRSRHAADDDDTRSVVSTRSRRDKDESSSDKKKEKKGGLFGLFARTKSTDDVVKSSKDDTSLSRTSTCDSKRDDEDEESRHRRKHRSRSEYGDDDDDTKSVKSSGKSRRHRSEKGSDEDSKERRRRSTHDDYDRSSPARSESGHRHHRRRGTDDVGDSLSRRDSRESRGAASESGGRHHHRRRTDEDAYGAGSRDQSFLGMRVEEMPPLPVSRPASPESAAKQQREGSSAEAKSGVGLVTGAAIAADLRAAVGAAFADRDQETRAPSQRDIAKEHHNDEHADHAAPTLESSPMLETPSRPVSMGRPSSSTAVPLHFPGRAPQTPGSAKDRAHSFSSPAVRSPATPVSPNATRTRQGRPQSTEIRPLYLVERNRQTPDVEDALPSLPSSKPSSRASSIQGSDENYQSAVEELDFDSPNRSRAGTLTLDTEEANAYRDDPLGSGEVTPKASEFHSLPGSGEKAPKQEPQFYTWEDFAQDERLHEQDTKPVEEATADPSLAQATPGLIMKQDQFSRSRSKSPGKQSSAFKSAAAAAMLGTAAVYAHHKSHDGSPERVVHDDKTPQSKATYDYPLPAPIEETAREREVAKAPILEEAPPLSRTTSSKKKKGKKGKKQLWQEAEPETSDAQPSLGPEKVTEIIASATPDIELGPAGAQDIEAFRDIGDYHEDSVPDSAATEVGTWSSDRRGTGAFLDASSPAGQNQTKTEDDRFLPSTAAHTLPKYDEDFFSRLSGEQGKSTSGSGSGVATPFMAVPTPAEEGVECELHGDMSKEDQARPATSYNLPTAKAEPAPLVIEQRNVEAAEPQTSEPVSAPKLTRKQSKKSKKNGKTAMLWEEESSEPATEQPLQLDTASEATTSRELADVPEEPLTAIEKDDAGLDAQPWLAEGSSESQDVPVAAQFNFGTHDFNQLAEGNSTNWQDAQAQAFQHSMTSKPSSMTSVVEGQRIESEDTSFEPAGSKKKGKKGKKSKTPTWSEDTTSEPFGQAKDHEQASTTEPVQESSGVALVAGLGAAAAAIGIDVPLDKKSKKKAKKDKKRQSASWEDFNEVPQPSPQSAVQHPIIEDETPAIDTINEQVVAATPELDLGPVGARDIDAFYDQPAQFSSEQDAAATPELDLGHVGATNIDAFERGAETLEMSRGIEPDVAEDIFPIKSKKKGKKSKKMADQAESSGPVSRAESPSASRQMSMDDSAFVDAEESQNLGAAQPDAVNAQINLDMSPVAEPAPSVIEDTPFVSGKKSKKDKKKKKSAAFFEPEPEIPQESATRSVSQSRRVPADESAFVDASEQQVSEDVSEMPQPIQDPATVEPTFETAAQEDGLGDSLSREPPSSNTLESFAPVPGKKAKKSKKKQQQSFDWASLDSSAPGTPEKRTSSPERVDLGPVGAQDTSAIDAWAAPGNMATDHDKLDLGPVGAQDTTAIDASRAIEDSNTREENPDLGPVGAQDTTAFEAGLTGNDAARGYFDLGPVGAQDTSAFTETEEVPKIVPENDSAPAKSSKKSKKDKKKKKSTTFDWENPDPESGASTPVPESRDELGSVPVSDTTKDPSPEDVPTPAATFSEEPLQEENHRDVAEVSLPAELTVDDLTPAGSSKKSKKDKKRRKSAADGPAPDVETTAPVFEPQGDDSEPSTPAVAEQTDVSKSPDTTGEVTEADAAAVEPATEDFSAPISAKQAKKDKKKKKQSAFAWDEPEAEPVSTSQTDIGQVEKNTADNVETPNEEVESAQGPIINEEDQQPPITETAPEAHDLASVSTNKSKKDKKKKKQSLGWDDFEPAPELVPEPVSVPTEDVTVAADVSPPRADQVDENGTLPVRERTPDQTEPALTEDVARDTLEDFRPQDEEPLVDAPIEEEFKPTLSRKQSKKDKKKKLQQHLEDLAPGEAPASAPPGEQPSSIAPVDNQEVSSEAKIFAPSSEEAVEESGRDINEIADAPKDLLVEAPVDDAFKPSLSRKQSKKDKKKALQQSLWNLESETGEDEHAAKEELEQSSSAVEKPLLDVASQEADSTGVVEPSAEMGVHPPQTEAQPADDSATDIATEAPALHSTQLVTGEVESDVLTSKLQDEPQDDVEWASSSKKKSKKGKKGRKDDRVTPDEPEQPALDDLSKAIGEMDTSLPTASGHDEVTATDQEIPAVAKIESQAAEAVPEDDSAWVNTSKKKGKKGKKSRQSLPSTPPVLEESATILEPETSQQKHEDSPSEVTAPLATSIERPDSVLPSSDDSQMPTQAVEQEEDLTWAPSSKKKKKGKNTKQDQDESQKDVNDNTSVPQAVKQSTEQSTDLPHVEASDLPKDESSREFVAETAHAAEEEPLDDTWGFSTSSKKKSKKGKKSATSTPASPPTERQPAQDSTTLGEDLPASGSQQEILFNEEVNPTELTSFDPEPQAGEVVQEDDATPDDAAWASSSKKKGKNGKKSQDIKQDDFINQSTEDYATPMEISTGPDVGTKEASDDQIPLSGEVASSTETPAEVDLWEAPASKKKKGKKGKKSGSGLATPISEPAEPSVEAALPVTETPDVIDQAAELPVVNLEPAETPLSEKEVVRDLQTSTPHEVEDSTTVAKNDPAVDLETAVAENDKPAKEDPQDLWASTTSKKKKGKRNKKGSGIVTPLAENLDLESSQPVTDLAESSRDVAPSSNDTHITSGLEVTSNEPAVMTHDDLENTAEIQTGYADDHEGPAHDTFDDVWAEEDITTHEDTATVQDLFEEPAEDARSSYTPASKKGKKKKNKGKKGSSAGLSLSNDTQALDTDSPVDQSLSAARQEPSIETPALAPTDEDAGVELVPHTTTSHEINTGTRDMPSEVVDVAQPEVNDSLDDTTTAPTNIDQEPEQIDEVDPRATESGSKKKGKKNKSKTTDPWADSPAEDTAADVSTENTNNEPTQPATVDAGSQAQTVVEPMVDQSDAIPEQREESAIVDDEWALPKAGKKKGKKGKKTQLDAFDALKNDTAADATPSSEPSAPVETPDSTATHTSIDSEEPAKAESDDVWALPTKAKKGKKGKKGKAMLALDEEVPSSTTDGQDATADSRSTTELVDAPEWPEEPKMAGDALHEQESEKKPEGPSIVEHQNNALEEQAPLSAEPGEADQTITPGLLQTMEGEAPVTEEQGSEALLPSKKSKNDKKKAKARASMADDFQPEPTSDMPATTDLAEADHSKILGAAAVATAALAGVVASQSNDDKPEEEDWAGFSSKKSKKDKKKGKKSGTATPVVDSNELPVPADTEVTDFAPVLDVGLKDQVAQAVNVEDPPAVAEENDDLNTLKDNPDDALSPRSLEILKAQPETANIVGDYAPTAHLEDQTTAPANDVDAATEREAADTSADHEHIWSTHAEETRTTSPHHPSQDIDFTATVAAGLADSGFNPDMVINDPVFQRRASPPGTIPEADPDEVFSTTTTKRKKGKKNKRSTEISEGPADEQATPANEVATDSAPADDFNDAITQSLQGTGFDPALLEKALASGNDQSSKVATEDPNEISFTTTKRKKGKKGKKSQADQFSETPTDQDGPPITTDAPTHAAEPPSEPLHELTGDEPTVDREDGDTAPSHLSASKTRATETDMPQQTGSQEEPQLVNILSVGRDEMDMDEMDRQYKEYRKNKRKQKKLKGAARAAGLSDNPESATEQSAMVSETEGLSAMTTRDDILSPQSTLDETRRQLSAISQPEQEVAPPAESVASPSSSAPAHSIFGERVKRRIPPKPKPEERSTEERQSSTDALADPRPEFGTAGMAAVVAAAARERKARQEASKAILETVKQEPGWSFDALDETKKPDNGSLSLDNKEYQVIRDSGYQEGTRSPHRASRTSCEIPDIVHTGSSPRESPSKDSLRQRRSLEPLKLATSPDDSWEINNPKQRSGDGQRSASATRSRTPSAETPLKPTSKDRVSYLFQSPPDALASTGEQSSCNIDSHSGNPVTPQRSENHDYFKTSSPRFSESHHGDSSAPRAMFSPDATNVDPARERSAFSPVNGPLSPRLALDSIPEERPTSKRGKSKTDLGGPEHIKAVNRAETPQGMRAREQTHSPSIRPSINIPQTNARSTSNPLSTDTLINRLSWPDIDEQTDTVNIDRHLGHRHSRPALPDPRSPSVVSNRSNNSGTHFKSPQELRTYSRTSNRSSTPVLRRTSLSGDLRAASARGDGSTTGSGSAVGARDSPKTIPFEAPPTPPPNDDELMTGSASRAMDMNDDVFGYGDAQQSQVSPTRPPSVRKRQSMHITDLESQLGQLAAENRALREAHEYADQTNGAAREVNGQALEEALAARDQQLQQRDHEISAIQAMLQPLQQEVARLTEMNGGLTEANRNLVDDTNGRYATLQAEHAHAHEQWQSAARELDGMRNEHGRVTSGMKDIVEAEIATALADKNAEILRLREQLDIAAEQIRALQVQIQSSKSSDFLSQRDEDYFDGSCQKLCQHVQQWVLRFSKLSDNRICRLSTDLNDDNIEARLDNAVLDGSDVDKLLGDRVRRRDVFMSVVMTMVWEYVFTRYLFGMDREQRQKLKALEKLLAEVGPPRAVSHWRATTLTLLAKRPTFDKQCTMDTEAVCHEIFGVLCSLLPPPSNSEQQLLTSLQKVIRIAVDLSIEMRTQRAEYIMLPPLQPEYDTNGDLVRKVHFNASLMNERSGFFSSNEELAAEHAVVKIVLFPLVVKKGDDYGEGEEEIVVCPAQVLVQNDGGKGKKVVRVMSGAMEIDDPIRSRQSKHSLVSEAPGSVGF